MEKKEIRKLFLKIRKNTDKKIINKHSFIIFNKIIQKFNLENKTIGLYFSINNEISCEHFINLKKIKTYFPKIKINKNNTKENKMYFCEINFNSLKNKKSYKQWSELIFENKIFEPKFKKNISIPEIILVPLVAFNKNCFRIGYGGGFYDKYLHNKKILKIGIASEFQKISYTPQKHDVQLDYIFTEKRIYRK